MIEIGYLPTYCGVRHLRIDFLSPLHQSTGTGEWSIFRANFDLKFFLPFLTELSIKLFPGTTKTPVNPEVYDIGVNKYRKHEISNQPFRVKRTTTDISVLTPAKRVLQHFKCIDRNYKTTCHSEILHSSSLD
jgi:hypothetical protein